MSYATEVRKWQQSSKLMPPGSVEHLQIRVREDLYSRQLYHISIDPKIKSFIPQVSRRTIHKEDIRVPRVCVAPGLIGCLVGYGGMWVDWYDNNGDWTIYTLDFDLSFEPNKKLLPDQRETGEHWLLTYSPETREYHGRKAGVLKCLGHKSRRIPKGITNEIEFVLDVKKGESVWVSPTCECREGYWSIILTDWMDQIADARKIKAKATQIDQKTYQALVSGKVTLLSLQEPASRAW